MGGHNRKRPPDDIVRDLLRFGFTQRDIAARFGCSEAGISRAARDIGLPLVPHGRKRKVNGAPRLWTRKMERWLEARA